MGGFSDFLGQQLQGVKLPTVNTQVQTSIDDKTKTWITLMVLGVLALVLFKN